MNYQGLITADKWRYEGQCSCGGTTTKKYEYIADRSIKLRIKPDKKKFNLYNRTFGEWDKALTDLETILKEHKLYEETLMK